MAKIRIQAFDLNGRKVGRIVGQKTLDSNATLEEAIRNGYVVGQLSSVKGNVDGVMRCMIDGIQRDGNGRKIDGYLSLNAFAKGLIKELTDAYESRKVVVRAHMLKEFNDKVDASKFSIIIEGSTGVFLIETVTTGEKSGEIVLGEDVALNGTKLDMGEGDTVSWEVPESGESGTVAAGGISGDATRLTIDAESLAALNKAANNGKDVVFTVKIGNKIAKKSALMRFVA